MRETNTLLQNTLIKQSLFGLALVASVINAYCVADSSQIIAQDSNYAIILPGEKETLHSLAKRFLGDKNKRWVIEDFNNITQLHPGKHIVIPFKTSNSSGVYVNGYQLVPILSYHRFGKKNGKLTVTKQAFIDQMDYLYRNHYRVIPLSDLIDYFNGAKAIPKRAVVITIDDGYRSTYKIAFPTLKKYQFQATIFLYTDFVGGSDALTWPQMKDMIASGLIDIQVHSKTHSNLGIQRADEDELQYMKRINDEIQMSTRLIYKKLERPLHSFAFPYGDTNNIVVSQLVKNNFRLGATVTPGGNPFFAYPMMLRRTMIFDNDDLEIFKSKITVFREIRLQ